MQYLMRKIIQCALILAFLLWGVPYLHYFVVMEFAKELKRMRDERIIKIERNYRSLSL